METGIKVGDCMKSTVATIQDDASIVDAAKKMHDKDVGSLLIVDLKKKPVGMVTTSDIVKKAVANKKLDCKVRDIASKRLLTVSIQADLTEAAKLMGANNIKRLLVEDEKGKLAGIISSKDIIRISPSLYDLIAERERLKPI